VEECLPLGGPVAAAELVGRRAMVAQLAAWLAEGFRLLLTGPSRCGKSSVLAAVAGQLEAAGIPTARVELGRCSTLRDAATAIAAAWPEAPAAGGASPAEALWRALQAPQGLGEPGTVSVLLLDGCEHLQRLGGLEVLAALRPALQRLDRLALLLAGPHGPGLAGLAGTRGGPFALPLTLEPPPAEAWRLDLPARLRRAGRNADPEAVERLIERTGGHPFDLMAACRCLPRREGRLGAAEADAAVGSALAALRPLLEAEAAALNPEQHGVLHRLANGRPLYREAGAPVTVKRAVDALVAAGRLRRARRGAYAFSEPLLADCLRAGAAAPAVAAAPGVAAAPAVAAVPAGAAAPAVTAAKS